MTRPPRPAMWIGLLLLLCGAALADPPHAVIERLPTREGGKSIVLSAEKSKSASPLVWEVKEPAGYPLFIADKHPRKGVYAAIIDPAPGHYEITVKAKGKAEDGSSDADIAVFTADVAGDNPNPNPDPPPGPLPPPPGPLPPPPDPPTPTPTPTQPAAHVTLLYDVDEGPRRTQVAEVLGNPVILTAARAGGLEWHAVEDSQSIVAANNYAPYIARAGGVPVLLVQAANGDVLTVQPMPDGPEAVAAFVKNIAVYVKKYGNSDGGGAR